MKAGDLVFVRRDAEANTHIVWDKTLNNGVTIFTGTVSDGKVTLDPLSLDNKFQYDTTAIVLATALGQVSNHHFTFIVAANDLVAGWVLEGRLSKL